MNSVRYGVIVIGLSLSAAAQAQVEGRYKAVTESEWNIELDLGEGGAAAYTLSSWQAGRSADTTVKTVVDAAWTLQDGKLTVAFPGAEPDKTVVYEVADCLSYASFGGSSCSAGLRPLSNAMSGEYRQPLWNASTFKSP